MDIYKIISHKAVVPSLVGVSIFSIGVAAGVALERFVVKTKKVDAVLPDEDDHPRLFDPDDPPVNDRVVITLDEAIAMREETADDDELIQWVPDDSEHVLENYIPEVMAEKTASAIPFNVLDSASPDIPDWDWDVAVAEREANPEGPYQIHEDEFAANSPGLHSHYLFFYDVDQIVCSQEDERDMMYDHPTKLGAFVFGYGAVDADTAFVRNVKERAEYQIVRLRDSYSESVMGIQEETEAEQAELAHMDRPLKMRRLE